MTALPRTSLSDLEHACLQFEEDQTEDPELVTWVTMLIAPGSSLGGAGPQACIMGEICRVREMTTATESWRICVGGRLPGPVVQGKSG